MPQDPISTTITVGAGPQAREIAILHRPAPAKAAKPALVWLGGYRSDMTGTKAVALDALAERLGTACIRFDYSGHGASGGEFRDGTISRWLEEALAVVMAQKIGSVVLVGSSMGGWIALRLVQELKKAKKAPAVAGLVLIAPAPDFTSELIEPTLTEAQRLQLEQQGYIEEHSAYSPEPDVYTRALIEDGRHNSVLKGIIETGCPVHILQGMEDRDFCQQLPEECNIKSRSAPAARLDARGWEAVREVNKAVNARYIARTDKDAYGREEYWVYPTVFADCEDFALEKRKELARLGFALSDLLITVVRKPDGEGHAVLTLRTTEGDFILDNLDNEVIAWRVFRIRAPEAPMLLGTVLRLSLISRISRRQLGEWRFFCDIRRRTQSTLGMLMNLWLRLFWLIATAWRRPPLILPGAASRLRFRVWPHDVDTSLHMNNGRYWTLMDLGRADLVIRSGLWRPVLKNGWTPVVSAGKIRFRRELRPFKAFDLETRLMFWDETRFVIEHRFLEHGTGTVAAIALVLAGFYDRKQRAFVSVEKLRDVVGIEAGPPPMTAEVEAFLGAEDALRRATATR
eukprot:g25348.t1